MLTANNAECLVVAATRLLRVHATANSHAIVLLLDSGASHNFLSRTLARKLRLKIRNTATALTVKLADGSTLTTDGVAMAKVWFTNKFY